MFRQYLDYTFTERLLLNQYINSHATGGEFVECSSCHNPPANNSSSKVSNPDNIKQLWMGSDTDFCLTCHDGTPPSGVSFPANAPGTGYDKSPYVNSSHDSFFGDYGCRNCHDAHGTPYNANAHDEYVTADCNTYATEDYQLRWNCHVENEIIEQEIAFKKLHQKHVVRGESPCIACHDVHTPYDSGEPGLISFEFAVNHTFDFQFLDGYDLSTSFWVNPDQKKGSCYLGCHAVNHIPEQYHWTDDGSFLPITITPTPSPTVTSTATVTPSPTVTGALTVTPTMTSTATVTPSPTATGTLTVTPAVTSTQTITPSLTVTGTPWPESSSILTMSTPLPKSTLIALVTATLSPTPTVTPSTTPVSTLIASTATSKPTSTLPAPTLTPSATITIVFSPTATFTSTPMSTEIPLPPATPALTPTATIADTPLAMEMPTSTPLP